MDDTATHQPSESGEIRVLIKEFIEKIANVDNEISLLKDDRKEIIEEYKSKLDVKTLTAALRVLKIQQKVENKDTFDLFLAALADPAS